MNSSTFAIVDIETTGSFAAASQITEIAIFVFDGKEIIDEYSTLINPEHPIPFHIQALTGITDEMVKNAPTFIQVADKIYNILKDRIFVAHNVHFDYSFIQAALKDSGYDWKAPRLCTVRLSRKIFPGLPSYSLGRLCQSLRIEIQDRHRAKGDAQATVILFERLYQEDQENYILKALQHKGKEQRLPTHVPMEIFNNLPCTTGVYLFRNVAGKIIYVGKANNIKKRVISHFTGNNTSQRRQNFLNEICDIEFEETGTELMAFLKECHLIKKTWPIYNRALKKFEPRYGLLDYEDQNGYLRISICQIRKNVRPIYYFNSVHESTQFLLRLVKDYDLDLRLCAFFTNPKEPKEIKAFISKTDLPDMTAYNRKVTEAIESLTNQKRSFVILDKGRNNTEKSYAYIKDNKVHAIGFISNDLVINNFEDIIQQEHLVLNNFYMYNLAENFARIYPNKVMHLAGCSLE